MSSEMRRDLPGGESLASGRAADAADIVLDVQQVSKIFRLYARPQDRLKEGLFRRFGRSYGHDFHALRDITFQLRRGDSLGILGRNGAGKSTLLQIIAGTLAPTTGRVDVRGRVAALLELGSGFNPEFTGSENVRLNATILGFTPAQIAERFDDIAAFADIGEFLDQPVKVYSSGMLVRLAFAVQAHLDPDILIVDEALAVGDVHFQHRCMRRIKELIDRGTLLLYVSHATETVKRFCRRGLWLDGGEMRHFGDAGATVEKYLAFMRMREVADWKADALEAGAASLALAGALEGDAAAGGPADPNELAAGASAAGTGTTTPDPALPLAEAAAEIDLTDPRLFHRGRWTWTPAPSAGDSQPDRYAPHGRHTSDATALAAFRCHATDIALRFVRGPRASDAIVTIDGRPRRLVLDAPEPTLETMHFSEPAGWHTVTIAPADPSSSAAGGPTSLTWAGGHAGVSPPLPFRVDEALRAYAGEVERYGTGKARFTAIELLDWTTGEPVTEVAFGTRVRLRLHAERLAPAGPRLEMSFIVRDRNRIDLFGTTTIDRGVRLEPASTRFTVEFAFTVRLGPGSYSVLASFVECTEDLRHRVPMDQIDIAAVFTVTFDPQRPVWYVFDEPVEVRGHVE